MVYRASALRVLGFTHIVIGSLMMVFGIVCIAIVRHWTSSVGFGIWVGIWVIITGVLGYLGARDNNNPNKCLIGCFLGFSVTASVIAGIMFICYCVATAGFADDLRYDEYYQTSYYNRYYSRVSRHRATVGAGLASCQLTFAIVEFFVSLASSIYCCNAVCCGVPAVGSVAANQQVVTYMHPGAQQIYPGSQSGVVIIQPTGAVATALPPGFTTTGQQPMYIQQQPAVMPPPGYWNTPSAPVPPGTVTVSYAGAAVSPQTQFQQPSKEQERPPPYVPHT